MALTLFQVLVLGDRATAMEAYCRLSDAGHDALVDDRDPERPALKRQLREGLMMGLPLYAIFGKTYACTDQIFVLRKTRLPTDGPQCIGIPLMISNSCYHDFVQSSRYWVVKVGTGVLTGPDGGLDLIRVGHLAAEVSTVVGTGRRVALVSSGAVGAGMGRLGLGRRPVALPQLQAVAAVGQAALIRAYDDEFRRHGRYVAQVLLTHDDFDHRCRYLNVRSTLAALFSWGAVPVINENDTISTTEMKFGDNDRLAALVANLLQAELLVILSVVDGLCRTDPATGTLGEVVPLVRRLDDSVFGLAGSTTSARGTGGMRSKLQAASLVTRAGGAVIIASGLREAPLTRILAGESVGTRCLPDSSSTVYSSIFRSGLDLTHQRGGVAQGTAPSPGVVGETRWTAGGNATPAAWNTGPQAP